MFCKCFILRVTTVCLQKAVFDPAKNVLQHFCKRFSVKHFKNILDVVTCKIKHLQKCLDPREVDGSKTFLQMFYFTSNHCLSSSRVRSC